MRINIETAAHKIQAGQIIAYPTEAVYGLGCDPFNQAAFNRLLALKERSESKGVILVASKLEQIASLTLLHNQTWTNRVLSSWESSNTPTTWILPITDKTPTWLTGGRKTLAVRLTHHPDIKALCNLLNRPIVSTSANKNQQAPAKTPETCQAYFKDIDILEGNLSGLKKPTQIWDAQTLKQIR